MRIVYIHQHFMTNLGKGGTRSYDVSRYITEAGHEIHMICGLYDTSGFEPMPWYQWYRTQEVDGIKLTICNVPYGNALTGLPRMWAFIKFVILATFAALRVRKPDLVFATSTPLFVGIPGLITAWLRRAVFIFEVRDMWPESFIIGGWATGKELYIKVMFFLEKLFYKHARRILLVSKGFEDRLIERGFPAEKMRTILLGADGEVFREITPNHDFIQRHGLEGKTIGIFTGAHGKANGLDYVLDAAVHLKDRADIAFVLIGEGIEKPRLQERAQAEGLRNIVFADPVPKTELPGILAVCHVGLMILKHIEGGRPVTPNKIFDYMFVGIPALVNFEGPTWDMVRQDESGLFVDPLSAEDLANKMVQLAEQPDLRQRLGDNGNRVAWEQYDRRVIAKQLQDVFEESVALTRAN